MSNKKNKNLFEALKENIFVPNIGYGQTLSILLKTANVLLLKYV